jgi:hypothetical protein
VSLRANLAAGPRLPYGERWIEDYLPRQILDEDRLIPLRVPKGAPEVPDVDAALLAALETSATPHLVPSLREWLAAKYRGGDLTVIVDDYTRPCVHQRRLLPGLLDWLQAHGVARDRISVLIALATHRDPRQDEYPHILGSLWGDWIDRVFAHHDREDLERLGTMPDRTPVELNGRAVRSEAIVSLSDLDYHYFAGVSGGPKHLVPGIAGRALTTAEHLQMFGTLGFAANCDVGILDGNPVYEYKRRAVRIALDALAARGTFVYAVISVLNPRQRFVALEGGEALALHRRMRAVLDRVYVAEVPRLADIVIVAAKHLGINVYQAGKAINAAARAVKRGGTLVCLAPCPDGFGNEEFRNLMAVAAPMLRGEGDAAKVEAIDRGLLAVQDVVMKDFRIGKQKPVDLLLRYRHVGPGNLWLLSDGLSASDRELLPFKYLGGAGDPGIRLRSWVEEQERASRPTYAVIDDPTYWIRVRT